MSIPPLLLSNQARRTEPSPIAYFIRKALENPKLISLAAGLVDAETLPLAEVAQATQTILSDPKLGRTALQYGTTHGYAPLRQQIVERFAADHQTTPAALNLQADDIILTTGSQQALYLVGEAICDEGDIIITEAPSYFVYHGVLQTQGVRTLSVPMDDGGMDLLALEALLGELRQSGELKRVKIIYTVSDSQNPTGLSLQTDRREQLVRLAQKYSQDHRILVLEDAAYRELCYDGPPQPAVKSFDPSNEWVIFTTTFSKPCAPGLKTGYTLMPAELSEMVARIKASHDFGSAHLTQVILDTMLRDGSYDQHAARLRANYRLKRDTMLEALQEAFADCPEVRWNRPVGGLYVYLSFPSEIPTGPGSELLEASFREGVMYIPGEFGHTPDANQPAHYRSEARLSFGVADLTAIREGVQRLRRAYTSCKPALVMA